MPLSARCPIIKITLKMNGDRSLKLEGSALQEAVSPHLSKVSIVTSNSGKCR